MNSGETSGPEVIMIFFMLSLAEHKILNASKYKNKNNIKKGHHFSISDKPIMLFFLLTNVKMPTAVGILTFMSRKNSCSAEHENFFITSQELFKERFKVNGYSIRWFHVCFFGNKEDIKGTKIAIFWVMESGHDFREQINF